MSPSFEFYETDADDTDSRQLGPVRSHSAVTPIRRPAGQANVPSRLVIRKGMSHAWAGWESESALIAEWFDEQLHAAE